MKASTAPLAAPIRGPKSPKNPVNQLSPPYLGLFRASLDLTDQDPTINQMMASLVLQVVRRMAAGTCLFMGLYLDMEQGTVTPTYATPEAVARVAPPDSEPGITSQ